MKSIIRFCFRVMIILWLSSEIPVLSQEPRLNDPVVEKIAEGFNFIEGPVWIEGIGLVFSDIPENTIFLFSVDSAVSEYLNPSGNSNGLALDSQGRLLLAQHGPRQIARLETNGTITPLATHYDGLRLNSPNDLAVKSNGSVFFTDPPYGLNDQGGTSELGYYGIYRLSPGGEVQLLDNSLARPNGICFSPDELKLYVDDSETRNIYVWDVVNDTAIGNKQFFAHISPAGYADGMKVDPYGYLYVSGPIGIWIFNQDGTAVDTIPVPGQTANCAWGNDDSSALYVTSGNDLYRISNRVPDQVSAIENEVNTNNMLISIPNPFVNNTTIVYEAETNNPVNIDIYNSSGEKISSFSDHALSDGLRSISWYAGDRSSGIYYLVLSDDNNTVITMCKMLKL